MTSIVTGAGVPYGTQIRRIAEADPDGVASCSRPRTGRNDR